MAGEETAVTAPTVTAEQIAACATDALVGQYFDADLDLVLVTTETTSATITGTVEVETYDTKGAVVATWYAVVTLGTPPGPDVSI